MGAYIRVSPQDQRSAAAHLAEIWQYRGVLVSFAIRDIILRYRQTFLGIIWVVAQPLISSSLFALIFGLFIKLPSEGNNYFLFVFAAVVPWGLFSNTIIRSGPSLTQNFSLITKVYFPRMIIPLASSASAVLDYILNILLLIGFALLLGGDLSPRALLLPFVFLLNMALAIGSGLFISSLNVYYRDFTYAIPFILQVLFYISPIAYSSSLIPDSFLPFYYLNPLAGIIYLYRWTILPNVPSPDLTLLAITIFMTGIVFLGSIYVFRRVERRFADVI
jgi:lipopolysaccharide transport system permease protein